MVDCLVSKPLLSVFDPKLPTELHMDASAFGYGGILMQTCDGCARVIGYFSKRTSSTETFPNLLQRRQAHGNKEGHFTQSSSMVVVHARLQCYHHLP